MTHFRSFFQTEKIYQLTGILLFVAMMAVGYTYNVTFIQLGIDDLGVRIIGFSRVEVAANMAMLAVLTAITAVGFGWLMSCRPWGKELAAKFKISLVVVAVQTTLTLAVPLVKTPTFFLTWLLFCAFSLGVGIPATFSMMVDLVPVRQRGLVAAAITALAYTAANLLPAGWEIEDLRAALLPVMLTGVVGLGILLSGKIPLIEKLALQHEQNAFSKGRFVRQQPQVFKTVIWMGLLMFGVFFIDSLGFLRLIRSPIYMENAWRSEALNIRGFIAGVHIAGALIAGILYANMGRKALFTWVFGIFALTHFMYSFHIRTNSGADSTLSMTMLYALAVSLYTVINFALWADLSTPKTIPIISAVGVSLSGWMATFLSTALAMRWEAQGISIEQHLIWVDALAMLLFFLLLLSFFSPNWTKTMEKT